MKTVSTKLDKRDFEKFQEMCNNEGQCVSEQLRDLVKMGIDSYEEGLELENEQSKELPKPTVTITDIEEEPKVISHGRILDDDGNVVGTF